MVNQECRKKNIKELKSYFVSNLQKEDEINKIVEIFLEIIEKRINKNRK